MRRVIAFLVSPSVSAFTASLLFYITQDHWLSYEKGIFGDNILQNFMRIFRKTCLMSYIFAIFPGLFFWLFLYEFKRQSLSAFMLSGGLVGLISSFCLWIAYNGRGSSLSETLIVIFAGVTGTVAYWCIARDKSVRDK